jgi:hypothetical protein
VRKTYLYLILFAGVTGVMFSTGTLLFQLLRTALGEPPGNLLKESLELLKTTFLFTVLLIYHWRCLRLDTRLVERSLGKRFGLYPVLVLASEDEAFVERLVIALERQAPGLPVAVHPVSSGAPEDKLSAAKAVILPADVLVRPSEALRLWLQAFKGVHLVVPSPVYDWHWVSGSRKSSQELARRTALVVRGLAEGNGLPQAQEASPWTVVVYVLAGLFALEITLVFLGLLISLINR